jgi:hypothetical protein
MRRILLEVPCQAKRIGNRRDFVLVLEKGTKIEDDDEDEAKGTRNGFDRPGSAG